MENKRQKSEILAFSPRLGQKRGLSAIVATLLIILLTLIAVGIIWVVVRGLVEGGSEDIDISARCLEVDVRATEVVPVAGEAGNYSVTLDRRAGGGDIDGVVVNVFNDTDSSGILDFGFALTELDPKTRKMETSIINGNKIEFTVYILDSSGQRQFCTQTGEYNL